MVFALIVALLGTIQAATAETAIAAAAAAQTATRAAAPESGQARASSGVTEVRKAVQAFRRVTSAAGLRYEGGAAPKPKAQGGWMGSWHGRVFEYFRNDILDAVPHEVVQRGGDRNLRRRNQFGFTVSGPLAIPSFYKGRVKSFFTFSYEGTRERVGRSYLMTLPTAQQRHGDFSSLVNKAGKPLAIYDPASTRANPAYDPSSPLRRSNLQYVRDRFPGNRVPRHRLDRVAQAASAEYPQPNTAVGPFFRNNYWTNPSERNSPDGFIARIDRNLGETQRLKLALKSSDGFQDTPDIYPTAGNWGQPDRLFRNREIEIADTVNVTPDVTFRTSVGAQSGLVDSLADSGSRDLPGELGLGGVSGTIFPMIRMRGYTGLGPSSRSHLRNSQAAYELENALIVRQGDFTWTISSEARFVNRGTLELDSPSGRFSFSDRLTGLPGITNTGDGFATFLLGQSWKAEATDQPHPAYFRRSWFQNSVSNQWQVRPNLTLTMRLRVDASSPRTEKFDRQSTFDPDAANERTGTGGALVFASRGSEGRAFQPFRVRLEPYLGVSWSPTSKRDTVVRGSAARYYSPLDMRSGPFATQGFSGRRAPVSANRQLVPAVTLADGFPALQHPLPDLRGGFANGTDVDMIPRTSAQPTFNYASMEIERKLVRGMTLRARGRTYRGRDMLIGGQIAGMNRVPVEALAFRDRLYDEGFRSSLRPFPQVQQIRMNYQYPGGRYRYDLGEVSLQKRTSGGLSLDLEYGFRKRWDDFSGPGVQDPRDMKTEWALSRGLRPQRLSLSYTYELPFGPGKPMLGGRGPLAVLMSDWSVSGFTTMLGGDPLVLEPLFNDTGGIVPYLRVDAVPGVDPHVKSPGPEAWFNPAAFVDPPDFALGGVPRTHPTLRNPPYRNHDISVTKRVALPQEQSVELLVQGFNFINQGNWRDPDTEIGPANARNVNAGRILGSRGGRVIQVGLRYHF